MNRIDAPVCVVDDDASIRESIEGLLRAEGLRTETYCSAREFLGRTNPEPPGCLVLDVELPDLSGLELQRELFRTKFAYPDHFPYRSREHPDVGAGDQGRGIRIPDQAFRSHDLLDAIQEGLLTREYGTAKDGRFRAAVG